MESVNPGGGDATFSGAIQRGEVAERAGSYLLWTLFSLGMGYVLYQLLQYPFGRDQGSYSMVGHTIATGGVPYRDVWEQKPPGLYYIYALAEWLFGRRMLAIRVLEATGLLVSSLILVLYTRKFIKHDFPALLGGLLAALMYVQLEFWYTAQAEGFAYFFIVAATYFSLDVGKRRSPLLTTVALGAIHGVIFSLKPNLAIGILVTIGLLWSDVRSRLGAEGSRAVFVALAKHGTCLSLGFVAVFAAWFSYIYIHAFEGFMDAVVWFNANYLRENGGADFDTVHWTLEKAITMTPPGILAGACCLLFFFNRKDNPRRGAAILVAQAGLQTFAVVVQGKLFNYHFTPVIPFLGVLASWGFWTFYRATNAHPVLVVATALLLLVKLPVAMPWWIERSRARQFLLDNPDFQRGYYRALYRHYEYDLVDNTDASYWIAQNTHPDDKIFVWGFEPTIYYQAQREPASRYIFNLPFRVKWDQGWRRAELMGELRQNRPAVIVVSGVDSIRWGTGNPNSSLTELRRFPALGMLINRHYEFATQIGGLLLFKRINPESTSPAASRGAALDEASAQLSELKRDAMRQARARGTPRGFTDVRDAAEARERELEKAGGPAAPAPLEAGG